MQQTNHASASHETLDQLRTEHGQLESRLQQLARPRSLSPEERYEMQVIKKRKLVLKDEISRREET